MLIYFCIFIFILTNIILRFTYLSFNYLFFFKQEIVGIFIVARYNINSEHIVV